MYKDLIKKWYKFVILIQIIVVFACFYFFDTNVLYVTATLFVYFLIYRRFTYKNYNGITGDLLGAFIETSELLMFITYLGVMI